MSDIIERLHQLQQSLLNAADNIIELRQERNAAIELNASLSKRVKDQHVLIKELGEELGALKAQGEKESLRKQLTEVRERERLLKDDVHNAVELNASLSKRVKELEALVAKWNQPVPLSEWQKMEAELAALKAGQGEPICYLREEWLSYEQSAEGQPGAFPVYTSAPSIPDSSIEHCLTCDNRGRVNGASQETYCEQCIYQRTWRKDHYAPKPGEKE